jgi:hypothetical protein
MNTYNTYKEIKSPTSTLNHAKATWSKLLPKGAPVPSDEQFKLWSILNRNENLDAAFAVLALKYHKLNHQMDLDYMTRFASSVLGRLAKEQQEAASRKATPRMTGDEAAKAFQATVDLYLTLPATVESANKILDLLEFLFDDKPAAFWEAYFYLAQKGSPTSQQARKLMSDLGADATFGDMQRGVTARHGDSNTEVQIH